MANGKVYVLTSILSSSTQTKCGQRNLQEGKNIKLPYSLVLLKLNTSSASFFMKVDYNLPYSLVLLKLMNKEKEVRKVKGNPSILSSSTQTGVD